MRVQSIQRAKCAVAEIAFVGSAVECELCHIAAGGLCCRSYSCSRNIVARARFNVRCD